MPAHLRVSLSDRPGALATLARELAAAGANVVAVTVIEREHGRAIDDILLDWPYQRPFDGVVRAVDACAGARLHGLRHIAVTAASRDCDVVQQVIDHPHRAVETLVDALPHVLLADWCAAFDRRRPLEVSYGTPGSPLPLPETTGALDRPRAFTVREEALVLLNVPASSLRLLIGRYEGPAFTASEVDRAAALVAVATEVARLAYAPAVSTDTTTHTARLLEPVDRCA